MKPPGRPCDTWVKQHEHYIGLLADELWYLEAIHMEWAAQKMIIA